MLFDKSEFSDNANWKLIAETPTRSRWVIHRMSHNVDANNVQELAKARRDAQFVQDSGLIEDRQAACSIQLGLQSNTNSHFTFGRFKKAAVHFHKHMHDLLLKLHQDAWVVKKKAFILCTPLPVTGQPATLRMGFNQGAFDG